MTERNPMRAFRRTMRAGTRCLSQLLSLLVAGSGLLWAAPFAEQIPFTQPDGTAIELWGQGDEFYANFETLDGYTVVFDQRLMAYCYAQLSADTSQLLSTGVQVQAGNPQTLGLTKHLRISPEAVKRQVAERYAHWDAGMEVSQRWNELKAAARAEAGGAEYAPPGSTTRGTKIGLCLLIDFDDDPATVAQAEIVNYCNGDNYTGYGNNGSVKRYFQDNANNLLTYSNVVTIYIRIPNSLHPKSWYNDTTKDCGDQANLLIKDALDIMKALPNYDTQILPTFNDLTVDANNRVIACNVFYAGGNGGVWAMGLWPHSWSLYNAGAQELSPGGKKVYRYQITNIGTSLRLGTFCHENGHMLCGFPDIYDYDYDSVGGAGQFCLMNSGAFGQNPVQVCAYLKRAAGWATTTELNSSSALMATVTATAGSDFNHFYRYQKPGVSTEYFLAECRYKTGRDANLPASGVALWHIDELGDRDDQRMTPNTLHHNYEVTLVQADNQWHFQNDVNSGDNYDLYHSGNTAAGYTNAFTDSTATHAHWWDGSNSRVNFHDFSARATTMTFVVGVLGTGPAITTQPASQIVFEGQGVSFSVAASGTTPLSYKWLKNSTALPGATATTYMISSALPSDAGSYSVVVTNAYGLAVSSNAVLTVISVPPVIVTQPEGRNAVAGETAEFSVLASGSAPLRYQWRFNGTNIAGATDSGLVFAPVRQSDAGNYSVRVTNAYGAVISSNAPLSVTLVAARGDNSFAQLNVPLNATNMVAIAAGAWHNLTLRADGAVVAWGNNWNGQCDVPSSLRDAVAIAGGGYHNLALKADRTVVAWGADYYGQTTAPPGLANVTAITAGTWHSLALRADGTVAAWGDNSCGQIEVPSGLANVVAVAAGGNHSLALKSYGTVVAWGENTDAQGNFVGQSVVPWGLMNVVAIAAGEYHSLALKADGTVVAWGDNSQNQAGPPTGLAGVVGVSGGGAHSLALKNDGAVVTWGNNWNGQCNMPSSLTNVVAIAAGAYHTLALLDDGTRLLRLTNPVRKGSEFSARLRTRHGKNYALEFKNSLAATNWTALPAVTGNGALRILIDPGATTPRRFYRVRQW
jgi:M6 family metalloprotease-like protein